jgi:hypothetical protein
LHSHILHFATYFAAFYQVFEAAMDAGADDVAAAENEDAPGFKASHFFVICWALVNSVTKSHLNAAAVFCNV